MARLTLSLLGGFQARLDHGPPLALPAKAVALLAYLALRPGQAAPRDKLGALLWGGTGDEQARSNLRHALFTIRKTLGAALPSPLVTEGQTVGLAAAACDVDARLFEALVREGTPDALERAAELYRGELLDGVGVDEPPFEEWLLAERERLRALALEALAHLLAHESKAGMTQRAIQTATRLLALDPLQEAVHRSLMRLYARQGRHAAALRQYKTCAEVLNRELHAEPEPQTRRLYHELRKRRESAVAMESDVATEHEPPRGRGRVLSSAPVREPRPEGASAPPDGERRHVTVLFADLGGSADAVLDRDPEEARRLLDPVRELMIGAVRRYGGVVNAVLGDGIIAIFGAPRAHEDHALRACYAALSLRERITLHAAEVRSEHGLDLSVCVALNSGTVVLRGAGDDLHADHGAVGQITYLAARMEQLATPGTIRLTAATRRLVDGYVDLRSLGRVGVSAVHEPDVFEVAGVSAARTRLSVAAGRGLTRFVGREAELALLTRAAEATWTGRGRVVAVSGEPGVGKSRLLHEFAHAEAPRGWRILETRGIAYGATTSYLPIIALLKTYLGVEDRDTPLEIAHKLNGTISALNPGLEPALPALAALLETPVDDREWPLLDPLQRRRRTRDAVKHLLLRASQARPVLLLFEDLHWIDGETEALLDRLVESLPAVPMLVVVTYRPEYGHGWANKGQYAQLRLETFPASETREMLQALLGNDETLESLEAMLAARAGGNPLFLEESVRALVETGVLDGKPGAYRLIKDVATVRVPATVQAVLAARIDRLPTEHKRLLQTAAVIGRHVPLRLLRAVVDVPEESLREALQHLQDAELLYEARFFPDAEYAFKHALTHEVAYESMLQERRRALHGRIVEAIERLHAGRLAEQMERLAHHAVQAELGEKAVRYLRQAGEKAAARSAPEDARAWLEQALSVLETLAESREALEQAFETIIELHALLSVLGEVRPALARLRQAEALGERLNDDRRRARVFALMTITYSHLGKLDEALASGTRTMAIARALDDVKLRLRATTELERAHYYRGDYERVVELATANLTAFGSDGADEYLGYRTPASFYDRHWLVMSLAQLGRFAEAAECSTEAIRLAEPTHAPTVGVVYFAAATLSLLESDWTAARSLVASWTAVVRRENLDLLLPYAVASFAWVLAELGETAEALDHVREAEHLLGRHAARGIVGHLGWVYHALGRALLVLGRLEEASRVGDRALGTSACHPGYAAHALHLLGDIATHPTRFDIARGEACYRDALALAEPRAMRPLVAHCHRGLGTVDRRTGKRKDAQAHLGAATTMYREMKMRFWLEKLEAETRRYQAPQNTS